MMIMGPILSPSCLTKQEQFNKPLFLINCVIANQGTDCRSTATGSCELQFSAHGRNCTETLPSVNDHTLCC